MAVLPIHGKPICTIELRHREHSSVWCTCILFYWPEYSFTVVGVDTLVKPTGGKRVKQAKQGCTLPTPETSNTLDSSEQFRTVVRKCRTESSI